MSAPIGIVTGSAGGHLRVYDYATKQEVDHMVIDAPINRMRCGVFYPFVCSLTNATIDASINPVNTAVLAISTDRKELLVAHLSSREVFAVAGE